jgi:TRAP-type mannitol/chloroaromatic compound transport system substrate-binding protein
MQSAFAAGDIQYSYAVDVAERITTATGGTLVIELFPAGAIVPATEEYQGIRTGAIQMCHSSVGYAKDLVPGASLFNQMCGGMSGVQMGMWYLAGDGMKLINEAFNPYEALILGMFMNSGEDWANTTIPLETLADVKKLKIRTFGDGGEILTRMGASAVFLPGGEIYESMQRGVINAFEYMAGAATWEMGFHEVIDYVYISLTRAPADGGEYSVNIDAFEALTPAQQEIVRACVQEELFRAFADLQVGNAAGLQNIRDYGVEVLPLPKVIEEEFSRVAVEFYAEKKATDTFYAKIVDSQLAFKALMELQSIY